MSQIDTDAFVESFESDWNIVLTRVETGRKLLDTMDKCLRMRYKAEMDYANALERIAERLSPPPTESSSILEGVAAVKSDLMNRATHTREFARSLREDVCQDTLTSTVANHQAVYQSVFNEGLSASQKLNTAVINHERLLKDYGRLGSESLSLIEGCRKYVTLPNTQRVKMFERCLATCRQVEAGEVKYHQSVEYLNTLNQAVIKKRKTLLQSLHDMDLKRMQCFKDALRKLSVYQVAHLRQIQYSSDPIIQTIETIDEKKDFAEFVEKYKHFKSVDSVPEITSIAPFESVLIDDTEEPSAVGTYARTFLKGIEKLPWGQQKPPPPKYAEPDVGTAEGLRTQFTDWLQGLWLGDEKQPYTHIDFQACLARVCFCESLRSVTVELGPKLPKMDCLRTLTLSCHALLDDADAQCDMWCAREVMEIGTLIHSFGAPTDDPCKSTKKPLETGDTQWLLQRALYHHVLWNRVEFWEHAFVMTLSEFAQNTLLKKVGKEREAPVTRLAEFARCMKSYGIPEEQINDLISRMTSEYGWPEALAVLQEEEVCAEGSV